MLSEIGKGESVRKQKRLREENKEHEIGNMEKNGLCENTRGELEREGEGNEQRAREISENERKKGE